MARGPQGRRPDPRVLAGIQYGHWGPTVMWSDDLGATWQETDHGAIRFPEVPTGRMINGEVELAYGPARHPSQLYEAGLEGILLFVVLWYLFWKTPARYKPGLLVGTFLLVYGLSRFLVEFVREPDAHLVEFAQATGLHMGQWLTVPMIAGGLYLIATAKRRAERVRPVPADAPA